MAAHLNITSVIATEYGVTLAAGTEADDCSKTETVEVSEVQAAATGEVILADPVNMVRIETRVTGDGPHALALTPGDIAVPSDLEVTSVEVSEAPNQRCGFSIAAAGHAAFSDPAGLAGEVGVEPTIADLEITSVEYAIAESVSRSVEVTDMVLPGTDGTPAARATVGLRAPFRIAGRGDVPAGLATGSGTAAFTGAGTGKAIVTSFGTGEKRRDWNRWNADGVRHPAA